MPIKRRSLRRLARHTRGAAAVEFALILPILLTLLFGGIDITEAVTARRKVAQATNTLSDLVAQEECVNKAFVDKIFAVGDAIVAPLPPTPLKAKVSSIVIDAGGNASVLWSQGDDPRAKGASFPMTSDLAPINKPSTSFVVAEASYAYTPVIGYKLTGTLTMGDITYALPRVADPKKGVTYYETTCP